MFLCSEYGVRSTSRDGIKDAVSDTRVCGIIGCIVVGFIVRDFYVFCMLVFALLP